MMGVLGYVKRVRVVRSLSLKLNLHGIKSTRKSTIGPNFPKFFWPGEMPGLFVYGEGVGKIVYTGTHPFQVSVEGIWFLVSFVPLQAL